MLHHSCRLHTNILQTIEREKMEKYILHLVSFLAGIVALLFPSMVTLGLGGYSALDTKFPPVVCFASILTEMSLYTRAAGTGQAGQAKTGPLFSTLSWVMVVYFIYRMVKIVR